MAAAAEAASCLSSALDTESSPGVKLRLCILAPAPPGSLSGPARAARRLRSVAWAISRSRSDHGPAPAAPTPAPAAPPRARCAARTSPRPTPPPPGEIRAAASPMTAPAPRPPPSPLPGAVLTFFKFSKKIPPPVTV